MSPKFCGLLLAFLAPITAFAQYRGVFSTAGGSGPVGSNTVQFTLGEPISGVIATSTSYRLSTGFYAPRNNPDCDFAAPVLTPIGPQTTAGNAPLAIRATVTDTDVDAVTLFYRKGGDPAFQETIMASESGNTYAANIPASEITSRGAEFFIVAVDQCDHLSRFPTPQAAESAIPIIVEIEAPGRDAALPQGRQQSNYRLISVPMELANKASSSVLSDLGAYDDTKWRFWSLKNNYFDFEDEAQYNELRNGAMFEPGSAFFLLSAEAGRYRTGAAASISTVDLFTKPLHSGWNFIGNPFDFGIPIDALSLSSGGAITVQTFNGGWTQSTTLQPFQGYIIDAGEENNVTLSINPDLSAGKAASKNDEPDSAPPLVSWSIRIDATSGDVFDINNMVAVGPEASREWDRMDRPEPPVLGDFVSVYFPHRDWGRVHKRYEVDARPEPAGGDAWDFEVSTGTRRTVTLTFDGLAGVPPHYDVQLIDRVTGQTQNVRLQPEYSVIPAGAGSGWPLRLLIGDAGYVEEQIETLDILPKKFELDQNYPNPFNPTTSIRFGLSEEATVTLRVFNLLGQVVSTLVDHARKEAGYHVARWDARFDDGTEAASGLYMYQLQISSSRTDGSPAGEFLMTRKMLLVK